MIIVLGIATLTHADSVTTTIGENISTNSLTATGLTINGSAATTGLFTVGAYTFPITDGSSNQVLKTDGSGALSWTTISAGSGSMTTIKENGVQLGGADIVTLDFLGADFNLTETPDTEVNIVINDAGIDHNSLANFVANEHLDWTSDLGETNIHAIITQIPTQTRRI